MTTPLLQVNDITVRFGGVVANEDVSLEICPGELVGVIGPNGAGKTTCIDAITGFVAATGQVTLEGTSLERLPAVGRARAGLIRTWQSVELFDDLTVYDNLATAAQRPRRGDLWLDLLGRSRRPDLDALDQALERAGIGGVGERFPDELSYGQRKLVGVARALVSQPRALCLDEPAAGLDQRESQELGRRLRSLADGGMTMLLVDHDMGLVLSVCDRIYVMETGRVIASGTPNEVRNDPQVIEAYLGTSDQEAS